MLICSISFSKELGIILNNFLYCMESYICNSVHRYNPEHDTESRLLRHRAAALQDLANSYLDHDLSEDFEKVHNYLLT